MTRPIKTIKRTKDMPSGAAYVATDHNGEFWAFSQKPTFDPEVQRWDGFGGWPVDVRRAPSAASTTLRRIVDPPKKPKRKMIRVWCFRDHLGVYVDVNRLETHRHRRGSHAGGYAPGPVESALIPDPRRKGGEK